MTGIGLIMSLSLGLIGGPNYDVLPQAVPTKLSLRTKELPPTYHLITHEKMLEEMGMKANPDYVGNLSEIEATAQRGGLASFLAIYGRDDEPRLLLNGIYFKNKDWFDEFVEFQRSKDRPIVAFKLKTSRGIWLLLVARDPDLSYPDEEKKMIHQTIKKYKKRLNLVELFDDMW